MASDCEEKSARGASRSLMCRSPIQKERRKGFGLSTLGENDPFHNSRQCQLGTNQINKQKSLSFEAISELFSFLRL